MVSSDWIFNTLSPAIIVMWVNFVVSESIHVWQGGILMMMTV